MNDHILILSQVSALLENKTASNPLLWIILVLLILVFVTHAFTRMTRHALASLRNKTPQEEELEKLKQNTAIHWAIENPRQFTSGIEFLTLFSTFVETILLHSLLRNTLILDPENSVWSLTLSALMVGSIQFLLIDWFFKGYATDQPEKTLRRTSWLSAAAIFIITPIKAPFEYFRNLINKWSHHKNGKEVNILDVEVLIHSLGDQETALTPSVRKIMGRAITLNELEVSDVLLPRNQVNYFNIFNSNEENLEMAKKSGHTRFPLCEGDLDNCIGIIHIKDIFQFKGDINKLDMRKMMRNYTTFSPDDHLDGVLQRLLLLKMHMAIVRDEFGGTIGLITLEQIIEELVGEIQDEFDAEEKEIEKLSLDLFRVNGLAPVHEVEEILNIQIDNEEVSTFGGLITAEIGRIPSPTEIINMENLEITIDKVEERRIINTVVKVIARPHEDLNDSE